MWIGWFAYVMALAPGCERHPKPEVDPNIRLTDDEKDWVRDCVARADSRSPDRAVASCVVKAVGLRVLR
jgi:hypothetical protein